jgi:hypothetical protein
LGPAANEGRDAVRHDEGVAPLRGPRRCDSAKRGLRGCDVDIDIQRHPDPYGAVARVGAALATEHRQESIRR